MIILNEVVLKKTGTVNRRTVFEDSGRRRYIGVNPACITQVKKQMSGGQEMDGYVAVHWIIDGYSLRGAACLQGSVEDVVAQINGAATATPSSGRNVVGLT